MTKNVETVRRLTDYDVKTIFECMHNNIPPPQSLNFQIVVVGSNGMRLSPPSYEFNDGLYVLLRPLRKNEVSIPPIEDPRIPSKLKSYVFDDVPTASCPWSLSGPQFPLPTAIQQRYCYPKGNAEYSNTKGGALWTAYIDGKEDLEYRLLHVYYSAKRAGNKGPKPSSDRTPPKKKKKPLSPKHEDFNILLSSIDDSTITSALCDSPLSFDIAPPSPCKDLSLSLFDLPSENDSRTPSSEDSCDPFQTAHPASDIFPVQFPHSDHWSHHQRPPYPVQNSYTNSNKSSYSMTPGRGSTMRLENGPHSRRPGINYTQRKKFRKDHSGRKGSHSRSESHDWSMPARLNFDPYSTNPTKSIPAEEKSWTDPFASRSSYYYPTQQTTFKRHSQGRECLFAAHLESIHNSIKDRITRADKVDQGYLISTFAKWAKRVAQEPFSQPHQNERFSEGKMKSVNDTFSATYAKNPPNKEVDIFNKDCTPV